MDTAAVAKDFTELCRTGNHEEAGAKYWSDDVVSIEAMDGPMKELHGRDAVKGKGEWWYANHTIHGGEVEGPYVQGDQFAVRFTMDITAKESGQRMTMDEIGLYTVRDGKIVEERFMYAQG